MADEGTHWPAHNCLTSRKNPRYSGENMQNYTQKGPQMRLILTLLL